jgi:hypothetical protein
MAMLNADSLTAAQASRKLHEETRARMLVCVMIRPDGVDTVYAAAMLLKPLWARSTHEMTFRSIALGWFEH